MYTAISWLVLLTLLLKANNPDCWTLPISVASLPFFLQPRENLQCTEFPRQHVGLDQAPQSPNPPTIPQLQWSKVRCGDQLTKVRAGVLKSAGTAWANIGVCFTFHVSLPIKWPQSTLNSHSNPLSIHPNWTEIIWSISKHKTDFFHDFSRSLWPLCRGNPGKPRSPWWGDSARDPRFEAAGNRPRLEPVDPPSSAMERVVMEGQHHSKKLVGIRGPCGLGDVLIG